MSWDEVFADLQAQFRAAAREEETAQVPELAEAEMAGVALADRIRARIGGSLTVRLRDGSIRSGSVQDATPNWVRIAVGPRRIVIPVHAVAAAWPLHGSAPQAGRIEARIGLGHVLRALGQQRMTVLLHTEGADHRGTVLQVGADHVDLAENGAVVTVAWHGLLSIEST